MSIFSDTFLRLLLVKDLPNDYIDVGDNFGDKIDDKLKMLVSVFAILVTDLIACSRNVNNLTHVSNIAFAMAHSLWGISQTGITRRLLSMI